jgi:tRNA-splicing ligase RtcB
MQRVNDKYVNFASIIDDGTLAQNLKTASMPFIWPYLASMPDAHPGKGAAIGSVIPTLGAVIPAAVGVDIGCGMIAVRTQFSVADTGKRDRKVLRVAIERAIPLSAGKNNRRLTESAAARADLLESAAQAAGFNPSAYVDNWKLQIGTLGSGNHFIEVSADQDGRVWLFLHSGSRGVGNKIAQHHIGVAQDYCRRRKYSLPDRDLAYLEEGTPEFDRYIRELLWAQRFALLNREEMMDRVVRAFSNWVGQAVLETERINCHHNYTAKERHFGREVWLTRKGAIDATAGKPGVIPGSMGTRSYVVEGKGFAPALNSAPHGAGREYSRTAARKAFSREDLRRAMKGIEYRDTDAFVDEIPAAYKNIDTVMSDAKDLVSIKATLRQIINVKGD